jgi:N-acetylmuramoyl-L-alanine amidase
MRHHRARLLNVLVLAPVAAIFAGVLGPTPHALAAASVAPAPIVITVDPGFGGNPTAGHSLTSSGAGAIGVNGVQEKTVDLDVGLRLAALLRADLVDVVMTRTTDVSVSDARRLQISIAHHAALVISIHANTASDPRTDGSMVMYPTTASAAFAQTLDDALTAQITNDGVPDDGFVLGDAAWLDNPVPVATVEMAYLSNPTDAALMATARFREDVAVGVRNGIEAYMPGIIARRNAILAWRHAHHVAAASGSLTPASATVPGTNGFQFGPVIAWLVGLSLVGVVLLFRNFVARVLVVLLALIGRLLGGVMWVQRAAIRRRRRRQRAYTSVERTHTHTRLTRANDPSRRNAERSSVYDDIPM